MYHREASPISLDYDRIFKTICVGDGGCGKTALTVRFTQGIFREQYEMTIGVGFAVKNLEIAGKKIKLHVWDTGGQERFVNVRALYYKGSAGALCVFDLTNRESFEHVPNFLAEINTYSGKTIPVVLVGNKSDLSNREVTREEAVTLAKKLGLFYLESSAKTGSGVTDCFTLLAAKMAGLEIPPEMSRSKEI